jgi:putative redox protein
MAIQANQDQLAQTIAAIRGQLGQAGGAVKASFAADTALADGFLTRAQIRQFGFTVDEPENLGGTDQGPNPVELVLAALGTCQEIVYATYARVLGVPLESVSVKVEGALDPRGFFGVADVPAGFQTITYTVDIQSPASEEQVRRLVDAVNSHCPVLDILRQPVPVEGRYSLNGAEVAA